MRGAILYQHGQQEQAEAIWSEVKQLISTASNADKAFISLKLGHTLLQPGETERGQKLFQDSEPYIRELDQDEQWREAEFMLDLVREWLQLQQYDKALQLIAELRVFCTRNRPRDSDLIIGTLAVLVLQYKLPLAQELWRELQHLAQKEAHNTEPYLFHLFAIASEMVKTGCHEETRVLLSLLQRAAQAHNN